MNFSNGSAQRKPFPKQFHPQLAFLTDKPPQGDDWLHEIKWDGYRLIATIYNGEVKLLTRRGNDWSHYFPTLVKELQTLKLKSTILDGEIVVLDEKGISRFQLLQNAIRPEENKSKHKSKENPIQYYVFDLGHYQGRDLTSSPQIERKNLLQQVFKSWPKKFHPHISYSEHIQGKGEAVFKKACQEKLEGIISKKMDSAYSHKRSRSWLKSKCNHRQEFIIGGFTKPKGSRKHFGALLVGYYNKRRELIYCGKVGTGFNEKTLAFLAKQFARLVQNDSSFYGFPKKNNKNNKNNKNKSVNKTITWVKPKLVCEIEYLDWTGDGLLRHPAFVGLREREDKPAMAVKKEKILQRGVKKSFKTYPLSNPDKILYPTEDIRKIDLAEYYQKVSKYILPHIINRPLLIKRCHTEKKQLKVSKKHSIASKKPPKSSCYFQKHYNESFPIGVYPIKVSKPGEARQDYIMIKDIKGLMGLVQLDVLEIHPWGSQVKNLEKPDRIIFDLDPGPGIDWKTIVLSALVIRQELKHLKLKSFVKTTGGKGLHIVIPIIPKLEWSVVKDFTHAFAQKMAAKYPEKFTATITKAKRQQKIFIDYIRNSRGSTAIGAYSTRAQPHAPVSFPVSWQALSRIQSSSQYNVTTLLKHLAKIKNDPWKDFFKCRQSIIDK